MPAGAKPGERRGGRPKGSKNKRTIEVEATLARLKCNPIEGMALIAMGLEDCGPNKGKAATDVPRELRAKMLAELAQYAAPKLKANEHSGPDGAPLGTASWLPPLAK
jgi:hypothetical protein